MLTLETHLFLGLLAVTAHYITAFTDYVEMKV